LEYKAEEVGVQIITVDESYTSKCSFLDLEPIQKYTTYLGKRISRSFFLAAVGRIIHADVNGAYNIVRKVFPKAFVNGIEDLGLHPVRWNLASATG
jgi:putative transposase